LQDDCEEFITGQDGFISSRFLRSRTGSDKYNIVSVSEWESRESFDAAFSKLELAELRARHPEFTFRRGFYDSIRGV